MRIWRGYGIFVCVFIALGYIAARIGAEMMWGNPLPRDHLPATELVGMLLSSGLIYCLHKAIDQKSGIIFSDDAKSNRHIIQPEHALFFVSIRFWPYITAALGLILFFR